MKKQLVVWDFDWSLVNENSDTYIIKQFDPLLAEEMRSENLRNKFPVWTDLMVNCLMKLKIFTFLNAG
jgi:pyridoxal phosphate phosphatase PHOSPHO2